MPAQRNQHKPRPPDEDIREPIQLYFELGLNDVEITKHLVDHYDTNQYGLSVITLRRLRKQWGLRSTRQQKHTAETIYEKVRDIRKRFPFRGAESIRKSLRELHGDHVPRELIGQLLNTVEHDAVQQRRHRGFKRRRFWAAGVNDVWPQDQHDKWGRFGLWLHAGLEAFSGEINWLQIWWNNRNPRLVARYFINTCRRVGGIPVITQSDPGVENNGVANVQTLIRHRLDPTLADTLQHRFAKGHNNILSEIKWSVFRRDFSPGFEDILEEGVHNGWYDVDDVLENLVFRWLAIPWLQAEIDEWVRHKNRSAPRAVKNKILPHGIPALIRAKPHHYDALDFKIPVSLELLDEVEAEYAPRDHPIFELVPHPFHERAVKHYSKIGEPVVSSDTFWETYRSLLQCFREETEENADLSIILTTHGNTMTRLEEENEKMALLPNMMPFRNGDNIVGPRGHKYIGGLVKPPIQGLRGAIILSEDGETSDCEALGAEPEYAYFTSDEDEDDTGVALAHDGHEQ